MSPRLHRTMRLLVAAGLVLAVAGAGAAALAGLGTRWGWWHFSTGFSILALAVYASVGAAVASAVAMVTAIVLKRPRLALAALPAIALAAAVIAVPLSQWQRAAEAPAIHDISTDLEDPPAFVALRAAREAAPNGVEHPGGETVRLQREAYPDLEPLVLEGNPDTVFAAAEDAARGLGWQVVAADPGEGRIEAVDRTYWFGFVDDVVIRVTGDDGRTRVDVRSASRVGKGDVGTNARRIREFLAKLQDRL